MDSFTWGKLSNSMKRIQKAMHAWSGSNWRMVSQGESLTKQNVNFRRIKCRWTGWPSYSSVYFCRDGQDGTSECILYPRIKEARVLYLQYVFAFCALIQNTGTDKRSGNGTESAVTVTKRGRKMARWIRSGKYA